MRLRVVGGRARPGPLRCARSRRAGSDVHGRNVATTGHASSRPGCEPGRGGGPGYRSPVPPEQESDAHHRGAPDRRPGARPPAGRRRGLARRRSGRRAGPGRHDQHAAPAVRQLRDGRLRGAGSRRRGRDRRRPRHPDRAGRPSRRDRAGAGGPPRHDGPDHDRRPVAAGRRRRRAGRADGRRPDRRAGPQPGASRHLCAPSGGGRPAGRPRAGRGHRGRTAPDRRRRSRRGRQSVGAPAAAGRRAVHR